MYRPILELMTPDFDLVVARRRAEALTQGSPSWDAAMSLVDELEAEAARRAAEGSLAEWSPLAAVPR